jgi:TfoX/Sxy family transcriptional regulator of competence genes
MAEPYRERLATMVRVTRLSNARGLRLECRHFFSGAALYANGTICASLTPVGFAVKLPEPSRAALLRQRRARPLRYFRRGPIKKEYVVLSAATASEAAVIRSLLRESIQYATRGKASAPCRP